MRIAHISSLKTARVISENVNTTSIAYMKDIRLSYSRNKNKISGLGITEQEFIKEMKQRVRV